MKRPRFVNLLGPLLMLLIAVILYGLWRYSNGLTPPTQQPGLSTRLMQRKLAATVELRRALQKNDFAQAKQNIRQLREISKTSQWYLTDQRYADWSKDFRQSLDDLQRSTTQPNLESAQAAYESLITSCVGCHQHTTESQLSPGLLDRKSGQKRGD